MTQQPPFSASGIAEYNFIGREAELRYLVNAMRGVQPTSQNIYGARRIGKSSLLWQFVRRWGNYMQDDAERSRFVVVHLSLLNSQYWTEVGLYRGIAQAVLKHRNISRFPTRKCLWNRDKWTREDFTETVERLHERGALLVLAWDDVEAALDDATAFDESFFRHLRYLMDHNHLMLVMVSDQRIEVDKRHNNLGPLFFNLGHCMELGKFTPQEVDMFLGQQDGSGRPLLSTTEQELARELGEQHPAKLQLAALKLWQAGIYQKDSAWVKQEFRRKWPLSKSQQLAQLLTRLFKEYPWKVIEVLIFIILIIIILVLILLDKAEVADLLTLLGISVPLVSP